VGDTEIELIKSHFADVQTLETELERRIAGVLHSSLHLGVNRPTLLVRAVRCIERGERWDARVVRKREAAEARGTDSQYWPPPRRWRSMCTAELMIAIAQRVHGIYADAENPESSSDGSETDEFGRRSSASASASAAGAEARAPPRAGAERVMEAVLEASDMLLRDLGFVRDYVAPCFPPSYDIFPFFLREYNKLLDAKVSEFGNRTGELDNGAVLSLIEWVGQYRTTLRQEYGVGVRARRRARSSGAGSDHDFAGGAGDHSDNGSSSDDDDNDGEEEEEEDGDNDGTGGGGVEGASRKHALRVDENTLDDALAPLRAHYVSSISRLMQQWVGNIVVSDATATPHQDPDGLWITESPLDLLRIAQDHTSSVSERTRGRLLADVVHACAYMLSDYGARVAESLAIHAPQWASGDACVAAAVSFFVFFCVFFFFFFFFFSSNKNRYALPCAFTHTFKHTHPPTQSCAVERTTRVSSGCWRTSTISRRRRGSSRILPTPSCRRSRARARARPPGRPSRARPVRCTRGARTPRGSSWRSSRRTSRASWPRRGRGSGTPTQSQTIRRGTVMHTW
jgi:hypothetical protein